MSKSVKHDGKTAVVKAIPGGEELPEKPDRKTSVLFCAVILCLIISSGSFYFHFPILVSIATVIVINLYLFLILLLAAIASDHKRWLSAWYRYVIPTRVFGLFLSIIILPSIVFCFANVFCQMPQGITPTIKTNFDAFYMSALSLTTLGYASVEVGHEGIKQAILLEVVTSINAFFGVFALLVGRLDKLK